jgi:hypothetical protein
MKAPNVSNGNYAYSRDGKASGGGISGTATLQNSIVANSFGEISRLIDWVVRQHSEVVRGRASTVHG